MPNHEDKVPSLEIRYGDKEVLLLKCHGCGASFEELLGAILGVPNLSIRSRDRSSSYSSYLRGRDVLTNAYLDSWAKVSAKTARIGIDVSAVPGGVWEANGIAELECESDLFTPWVRPDLGPHDLVVRVPRRASYGMVETLMGFVSEANRRLKEGWDKPIVYGSFRMSGRVGVSPSAVSARIRTLERHELVECVGRLPKPKGCPWPKGAKKYRLVVEVP
jgi:hypothetical protein